jgi:dolichyl-phosphate beta-glucosyltransferase
MISPELSVIVPAYNEEDLIVRTLDGLHSHLSPRLERYEIIVVDDGSQDATVAVVQGWHARHEVDLRLFVNPKNMGKGYSIRRGVLESRGQFVLFIDADLPYELDVIEDFLKALRNGYDLAIGSRVLPGAQVRGVPPLRFVAGQVFSWMVQVLLFSGLPDTQCGFKSFRSAAAKEIFQRTTIDGFGFDVETLYLARKLKFSIQPFAVRMIDYRRGSRVRLLGDSLKMFSNLFTIRWNDWRGRYK